MVQVHWSYVDGDVYEGGVISGYGSINSHYYLQQNELE